MRKFRNLNKHGMVQEYPINNDSSSRSKGRKRKLSNLLGDRWSTEELEFFYEAYQKYGKDWEKISGALHNRSLEMVEVLYNMNKAYLSLPDGTATVAGLTAMMTDHYNVLEASDNDGGDVRVKTSTKLQSRGKGKIGSDKLKLKKTGPYPDLAKKAGAFAGIPRVVGKRTPRFPVSYTNVKSDKTLALAEACHGGVSPLISQTSESKTGVHIAQRKHVGAEDASSKLKSQFDEENNQDKYRSSEAENNVFSKNPSHRLDFDGPSTVEPKQDGRPLEGKKQKCGPRNTRDTCYRAKALNSKSNGLKDEAAMDRPEPNEKGSWKLFRGDESTSLDKLQILADLSLNMLLPSSALMSEASPWINKEKKAVDEQIHGVAERSSKHALQDKDIHESSTEKGQLRVYQKSSALEVNISNAANLEDNKSSNKKRATRDVLIMDSCEDRSKKIKAGLSEEQANNLFVPSHPDRQDNCKRARFTLDMNYINNESAQAVSKIDDLTLQASQSEFVSDDRNDIMSEALGREEHSGRVRGVDSRMGPRQYFGSSSSNRSYGGIPVKCKEKIQKLEEQMNMVLNKLNALSDMATPTQTSRNTAESVNLEVESPIPIHAEKQVKIIKKKESNEPSKTYQIKAKSASEIVPLIRQENSSKPAERSASSTGIGSATAEEADIAPQVSNKVQLLKNKRKRKPHNALASKEEKAPKVAGKNHPGKAFTSDLNIELKEKLYNCISSSLLRRWCVSEWFYSAIDYPWFARSEFIEYLSHVHFDHIPRLTRTEWGVIKSSLGKPRRFCQQFLNEEKQKLEDYRELVRKRYFDIIIGTESLPPDLAPPLTVGQCVLVCHPKTREINEGCVLTIDSSQIRVQFNHREMGVQYVMDVDCMPLNPSKNMPNSLRKRYLADRFLNVCQPEFCVHPWGANLKASSPASGNFKTVEVFGHCFATDYLLTVLMKDGMGGTIDAIGRAKVVANRVSSAIQMALYTQPFSHAQLQGKEDDLRVLSELTGAFEEKEDLLVELKNMKEEVSRKQKDVQSMQDLEIFKEQYGLILSQLHNASEVITSCLYHLKQRNTLAGVFVPRQVCTVASVKQAGPPSLLSESANGDSGSNIMEIMESSRNKATTMVNIIVKALSSLKEGENTFVKVSQALDSPREWQLGASSGTPASKVFHMHDLGDGIPGRHNKISSPASARTLENDVLHKFSCGNDYEFPSELISSCITTLLMIQRCTVMNHPPAEIALILDSAIASLLPNCAENLPIYGDIELIMGIIKNQMLSLIPTPHTVLPVQHTIK